MFAGDFSKSLCLFPSFLTKYREIKSTQGFYTVVNLFQKRERIMTLRAAEEKSDTEINSVLI